MLKVVDTRSVCFFRKRNEWKGSVSTARNVEGTRGSNKMCGLTGLYGKVSSLGLGYSVAYEKKHMDARLADVEEELLPSIGEVFIPASRNLQTPVERVDLLQEEPRPAKARGCRGSIA
jgi:hypothetical protein